MFKKGFTRKHIFVNFYFSKLVSNKVRIRRVIVNARNISYVELAVLGAYSSSTFGFLRTFLSNPLIRIEKPDYCEVT